MALPEQLGPYRLGRRLGRGGMGTVYAAVNVHDEQPAAVKVLAAALSHDEGFRVRFDAEVESLRKLRHPHIVRLYGFGEQDELLFYGMELVEGRSLEEELAAGRRFDWSEVTRITLQTCRALKHAHDRGIIHRDIKPANLMLTAAQEVKLSDFGIAKLFGSTGMTAEGGIIGTAEFMAPEQADGRAATERTDLYSLGGLMYALLARRPPFRAKTLPEMLQLQRFAEPDPVRRYAPDTPPELEKIILQLLAKEPEKRLANAGVLIRRLEGMIEDLAKLQPSTRQVLARTDAEIANAATLAAPENGTPLKSPSETQEFLPAAPNKSAPTGGRLAATVAGDSSSEASADQSFELAPTIARQTTRTFKTVEEADQEDAAREQETTPLVSVQTIALVSALGLAGLFIWWMLQPPSVAAMLAKIEAADGKVSNLSKLKPEIDDLLSNHSVDLTTQQKNMLAGYLDDIALEAMERRMEMEVRRMSGKTMTPIERAYLDAQQTLRRDETAGLRKLKAIVQLYGTSFQDETQPVRLVLRLARGQIKGIEEGMGDAYTADRARIVERIGIAKDLGEDDPTEGRRMYEALLEIYGTRPWASDLMDEVKKRLAELPPAPPEPPVEVDTASAVTPELSSPAAQP
jgi:serine/threonine-protein kinase